MQVVFRRRPRAEETTESFTTSNWSWNDDEPPPDPVLALQQLPEKQSAPFGPRYDLSKFRDGNGGKKWISIGRRDDNDMQFLDRSVSEEHCQLCRTRQGRLYVRHWPEAKNSTKVNRKRVRDDPAEIVPGDVLRCGRVRLLAVSAKVTDVIRITADNPVDYVRRLVGAWGTFEKVGKLFGKNRSTIKRWYDKGGFGL